MHMMQNMYQVHTCVAGGVEADMQRFTTLQDDSVNLCGSYFCPLHSFIKTFIIHSRL